MHALMHVDNLSLERSALHGGEIFRPTRALDGSIIRQDARDAG